MTTSIILTHERLLHSWPEMQRHGRRRTADKADLTDSVDERHKNLNWSPPMAARQPRANEKIITTALVTAVMNARSRSVNQKIPAELAQKRNATEGAEL